VLGLVSGLGLYQLYTRTLCMHRNGTEPLSTNTLTDKLRTALSMFASTILSPVLLICRSPETPRLVYKPTAFNKKLAQACPTLHKFNECFFLGHPMNQTLHMLAMDIWCRQTTAIHRRELVTAADGGTIGLHWRSDPNTVPKDSPVVVLCPGFCEDSCDYPPFCVTEPLVQQGYHVVVYIRRGLSDLKLTTAQPFCLRGHEDLSAVLSKLRADFPKSTLLGVGLSTGAAILQRYVETTGVSSLLHAACTIDTGADWHGNFAWLLLKHPLIVTHYLLARFKSTLARNPDVMAAHDQLAAQGKKREVDWEAVFSANTAHDFFEAYHGRMFQHEGFYLQSTSPAASDFDQIQVPLLALVSNSDFLVEKEARDMMIGVAQRNENILLCVCERGGHTTRSEGLTGSSLWMGRACNEFFQGVLGAGPQE